MGACGPPGYHRPVMVFALRSTHLVLLFSAALATAACGGSAGAPGTGGKGSGSTSSTAASTGSASSSASGTGGASAGHLVVPSVIDLPYVVAGQGGSMASVDVQNDGDAPLSGLTWSLSGDPSLTIGPAPASLAPGEHAMVSFLYAGSATEAIAAASLAVGTPSGAVDVPVFGVAGDPGLGASTWEDVAGAGGVVAGSGATIAMPAAPYPDGPSSPYSDPSVRVFLAEGYRDRGAQDLVVHFHGFDAVLAATLAAQLYQQHVYESGSNAVLVVPQGPVNADSGDFGKLMMPGGMARLATEVLVVLYRDGKITHPAPGELALTSHSGGYQAVAYNLGAASLSPAVKQVDLFDSLYGEDSTYEAFALAAGTVFRSNYTSAGGTLADNQAVAAYLAQNGPAPAAAATQLALDAAPPVVYFADTSHYGSIRLENAFGEELRWRLPHARRGPRIELRQAVVTGGMATVRWLAPPDEDLTGFIVETSPDGTTWTTAATTGPTGAEATFPLAAGARVHVKGVVTGVAPADVLPSDTYRMDPQPALLVVDGFDRVLDGGFGGLYHDFAAVVGEAAGPVASVSHRAITEDGFSLAPWSSILWLLGDESTDDLSLSAAEQTAIQAYVDGGGHLVISGSELAYDIGQTQTGAAFLAHCFGAAFYLDASGSYTVAGTSALTSLASFGFSGTGAAYQDAYPDVLTASGGTVLLTYGTGTAAAVGIAGKGALVGFPLELVDTAPHLSAVVKALLAYAGG
jgi:hypothetical protein